MGSKESSCVVFMELSRGYPALWVCVLLYYCSGIPWGNLWFVQTIDCNVKSCFFQSIYFRYMQQ